MTFLIWAPSKRGVSYMVDSQSHFDVMHYMAGKLDVEPTQLQCIPVPSLGETLELEWRGSDFGAKPDRALWVRERERDAPWGEWRRT